MKEFLGDNWLLDSDMAERLYHEHAKMMPIIDYHCHLSPKQIAENKNFKNITEVWLKGDHYKWRAMRANGISEKYITGAASDEEKFAKWAETVPYTMRNPLYHWTHLELRRYFGISDLLSEKTAAKIFEDASSQLAQEAYCPQSILAKMNVEMVGTTDDPTDTLEYHQAIKKQDLKTLVIPTFRPDRSMQVENPVVYNEYLDSLSEVSGIEIKKLDNLIEALNLRMDFFLEMGCKASDHGFNNIPFRKSSMNEIESSFDQVRKGNTLDADKTEALQGYILLELAKGYHARGWAQQYHLGALRNTNDRATRELGPDTGFDSIGDFKQAENLYRFLNELNNSNQLTKTILYNLNPADNEVFATMAGNYNDGVTPGKMQFGSGWWYLDQKDGMTNQINALSNMGLLSRFIGMLTDSRSFLSFPRHEYFRRILCNIIGNDVVNGELPNDFDFLSKMIEGICANNARKYFNL